MKLFATAALIGLAISTASMAQTLKPFDFKGITQKSTPAEVAALTGKACENDTMDGQKITYCDLPSSFLPTMADQPVEMASILYDDKGMMLLKVDVTGHVAPTLTMAFIGRYGVYQARDGLYNWDFSDGRIIVNTNNVDEHDITTMTFWRSDMLKQPQAPKAADF